MKDSDISNAAILREKNCLYLWSIQGNYTLQPSPAGTRDNTTLLS